MKTISYWLSYALFCLFLLGARCNRPLGMQNGRIRANQLTASSSWDKNHAPSYGRLHFRRAGHRVGAWCSRHNNRLQWFQVYFGRPTRVVKFATQGRQDARQWVTQYYLTFSQDGVHSAEYKENSNRKVHHNCSLKFFKRSFFPNSGHVWKLKSKQIEMSALRTFLTKYFFFTYLGCFSARHVFKEK